MIDEKVASDVGNGICVMSFILPTLFNNYIDGKFTPEYVSKETSTFNISLQKVINALSNVGYIGESKELDELQSIYALRLALSLKNIVDQTNRNTMMISYRNLFTAEKYLRVVCGLYDVFTTQRMNNQEIAALCDQSDEHNVSKVEQLPFINEALNNSIYLAESQELHELKELYVPRYNELLASINGQLSNNGINKDIQLLKKYGDVMYALYDLFLLQRMDDAKISEIAQERKSEFEKFRQHGKNLHEAEKILTFLEVTRKLQWLN